MNPRSSHTHCQVAQAVTQAKTWQRVYLPHPAKIELKKFPFPSENIKYAIAQPDTKKIEKRSVEYPPDELHVVVFRDIVYHLGIDVVG